MNLTFSILSNGPDPALHEVLQIGAAFFDDHFIEKESQFGAFVRCEEPERSDKMYLQAAGFDSVDHLKNRRPNHEPFEQVWNHFQDWCLRHSPYDSFSEFCSEVSWAGHRLQEDLWFLTETCRRRLQDEPFTMRDIRSMCDLSSTACMYESIGRYLGKGRYIGRDLASIADFFGVPLSDRHDPTARAIAIGQVYHTHLKKQKELYEKI